MPTSPFATGASLVTEGRKASLPHFSIPAFPPPQSATAATGNSPSASSSSSSSSSMSTSPSLSYSSSATSPSTTTDVLPPTPSETAAGVSLPSSSALGFLPPTSSYTSGGGRALSLDLGVLLNEGGEEGGNGEGEEGGKGGKGGTDLSSVFFGGSPVELRPPTLPPLHSPQQAQQRQPDHTIPARSFFPPSYTPVASSSSTSTSAASTSSSFYPPAYATLSSAYPSFSSSSGTYPSLSPSHLSLPLPPTFPIAPLSIAPSATNLNLNLPPSSSFSPSSLPPLPLPPGGSARRRSSSRTDALRSPRTAVLRLSEDVGEVRGARRKSPSSAGGEVGGAGKTEEKGGEKEKTWLDRLREAEVRAKLHKKLSLSLARVAVEEGMGGRGKL